MKDTLAAERYSRALFLALEESKTVSQEEARKILGRIVEALKQSPAEAALLENPLVPAERKMAWIRKTASVLQVQCPNLILRFMDLLIAKKRMGLLPEILFSFEKTISESQKKMKVTVNSAVSLDTSALGEIEERLSRLFNKKVTAENRVHPELLAGVCVEAGGTVIDNSLKTQLKNMARSFALTEAR